MVKCKTCGEKREQVGADGVCKACAEEERSKTANRLRLGGKITAAIAVVGSIALTTVKVLRKIGGRA